MADIIGHLAMRLFHGIATQRFRQSSASTLSMLSAAGDIFAVLHCLTRFRAAIFADFCR